MFLTALLKAISFSPLFNGDWEVSMLFSHIITSRISTILLGITSNNRNLLFHQAAANLCLNYSYLLTSIEERKGKKPQSLFGMGTFTEQLLTGILIFFQTMHASDH